MNVSLDTDVVIHLYKSKKKELLFFFFEELFMHEYLLKEELQNKCLATYNEFKQDIDNGYIKIITNRDLIDMGIKGLFENYKESNENLFDGGELHAVALAKAMGIPAFVSDDTKEGGPHETLVKELIEGVMPFSFYELLFLKYLKSEITKEEMYKEFEEVNKSSMPKHPMRFRKKILLTVRRFSKRNGSNRDIEWLNDYCNENSVNYRLKMKELKEYLNTF